MGNLYESIEADEKKLEEEVKASQEEETKDGKDEEASVGDDDGGSNEQVEDEKPEDKPTEADEDGADGDESPEPGRAGDDGQQTDSQAVQEENDEVVKASAFARLRREAAAAEKRAKELEQALAAKSVASVQPQQPQETKAAADPEPNREAEYEKWLEWRSREVERKADAAEKIAAEAKSFIEEHKKQQEYETITRSAIDEFNTLQMEYKKANPDYDNAFNYGYNEYYRATKIRNPGLSNSEIGQMVDRELLAFASQAVNKGLNPAEELYSWAIESLNYRPPQKNAQQDNNNTSQRPPLRTIENNKRRSATSLNGGGQTGATMHSLESVAKLPLSEFSKLSEAQLMELEKQGG